MQESMAWGGLFLSMGHPTQEQQKSCLAAAGGFNYDTALHGATRPKSVSTLTSGEAVGETSDKVLTERGFFVNRSRVLIGSGSDAFVHAKSALLSWRYKEPEPARFIKKNKEPELELSSSLLATYPDTMSLASPPD